MSPESDLFSSLSGNANVQKMPLLKVIENYLAYYAGNSSHTSKAKQVDLRHFEEFLTRHFGLSHSGKLLVEHWDFSSTQRFVDELLERGEAPTTAARRLATLKHMGRTLADKVPGFVNPAREVKAPKTKAQRPKAISQTDIEVIREERPQALSKKGKFKDYRNYVLFEFLLDTGIRADEVRLLRYGQLDERLEWIKNVRTKGRRFRNVYITSNMRPLLEEYLRARDKELARFFTSIPTSIASMLPVFVSTYKADPEKPDSFLMGPKTIWRAVRQLSQETKLHPHLLRHSYALDLLDSAKDIRLVAQALGHSDVRVTMRYTERGEEEVASALEETRRKD